MDINDINKPFAINGDRTPFSYEVNVDGLLSWLGGYPINYALKPEEGGRYIERAEFNEILYLLSSLLLKLQNNSLNSNDINDITNSLNDKLDARIYYNDKNYFVTTNTNQYINAKKTFNVTPACINNPVEANDLVRLGYFNANLGIGYNQKWYDVRNQRNLDVTYTNNTNKPIQVYVSVYHSLHRNKEYTAFKVDNVNFKCRLGFEGGKGFGYYINYTFTFMVPPSSTYIVFKQDKDRYEIINWIELR